MVSTKKFLNIDNTILNYLIDFYIADDRFVRCFNYYYNPDGVEGDTENGIFIRTADAPEDEDMIDPSKYAIVNNSVMFYEGLPADSTLVVEVATDLEEIGEAIRNIYSQEAKEYYNMIKNIFYGESASEPTTRPDGTAIIVGDLYLDTSVSPERMKVYSSTLGWTDATYNDTDIDKVTTVADDLTSDPSNVKTVAGSIDNVNTTAGSITNVNTVADDLNLTDSTIKTVAASIDNVNITGSNIDNVNTFANIWQGAKDTDPTTRNDGSVLLTGDLYFNTTDNVLKQYDGTNWTITQQYSDLDILDKLKNVDGDGSGLDADTLDSKQASDLANYDLSNTDDSVILNKLKNVDGAGSGLDADLVRGKTPLYREPDFDSGWFTAADNGTAIMIEHGLGVIPNDVRLFIRNEDTGSIRITLSQYIIYSSGNTDYYGQSLSRINDTYISVYSGSAYKLGGTFLNRYDGTNSENDTNNVSIRVLCWK